ncbi:MAG: zinc ribbon domain-containing protein [Thermoguttaceae bacterium]|jgi:putative FmdB family regulatory protein|nr:zinc ribbon domain-containing protein [Thermoguttaceae bacterium]
MPIYEYSCDQCGHEFEVLVRTQDERPECPACGRKKLTKRLSLPVAHSTSNPACPAKDLGMCGAPRCGEGGCALQ